MSHKISTALISVSDKTGIAEFATFLSKQGVKILSTGGTAKHLKEAGVKVTDISEHTGFPEMMDGRVKTLHPKVHGGLLALRDNEEHQNAAKEHDIAMIDLVVVNLYPFEETVKKGASFEETIEHIDIGGPSMVRSAAKNHEHVLIITHPQDYKTVQVAIEQDQVTAQLRKTLAAKAFARTASYDAAISGWFAQTLGENLPERLTISGMRKASLRYGENPHQHAALYVNDCEPHSVAHANQLQGKELSYNNLADADAAFSMLSDFEEPSVAIIKHANPCGFASANTLKEAYEKALASDPVSAYGGIVAVNQKLDLEATEVMAKLFMEVLIAPDADEDALERLKKKKNLRVLLTGCVPKSERAGHVIKSIDGGFLIQSRDAGVIQESELKIVSERKPSQDEINELLFAFRVCKYVKSNAIVITQGRATIGIGAGQTSRVAACAIAAENAKDKIQKGQPVILASDAFFPFADGVEAAAKAGVTAIIQPGGSIRDEEVIEAANKHNIAMAFTGMRHFRH